MSMLDYLNQMTPEEKRNEGIGALWDAIDEALDCKEASLPDWLRKELEQAQTKATMVLPHLRSAWTEKKRAGL
jgi:hypothetical protein